MMQERSTGALVALVAVAAFALTVGPALVSGCAGGSSATDQSGAAGLRSAGEVPPMPSIYSDPTYGFTLQIDGTFEKDDALSSTDPADYYIVWEQTDGPIIEGHPANTILVSVDDRGAEMTPAEVEAEIAAIVGGKEAIAASLGHKAVVTGIAKTTIDESPAVVVDATATMSGPDGAVPVTVRHAYVFQGQYVFTISCTATTDTWAENEPFFQASILSFTAQ
jgi:hypothetical protein